MNHAYTAVLQLSSIPSAGSEREGHTCRLQARFQILFTQVEHIQYIPSRELARSKYSANWPKQANLSEHAHVELLGILTRQFTNLFPRYIGHNSLVKIQTIFSRLEYCLINEQECFITRPASLLNGFKHDYKFNRYTALLVFFI